MLKYKLMKLGILILQFKLKFNTNLKNQIRIRIIYNNLLTYNNHQFQFQANKKV